MRIKKLLHKLFENASLNIDKRLHRTLLQAACTLSKTKQLSITGIGRALKSSAFIKHSIKRVDRLFGNSQLNLKSIAYYRSMAQLLIGEHQKVLITVDWSGLTRCGTYHFLRASIPVGGRTLTILDKAYLEKYYGSRKAHKEFLTLLKSILPSGPSFENNPQSIIRPSFCSANNKR